MISVSRSHIYSKTFAYIRDVLEWHQIDDVLWKNGVRARPACSTDQQIE